MPMHEFTEAIGSRNKIEQIRAVLRTLQAGVEQDVAREYGLTGAELRKLSDALTDAIIAFTDELQVIVYESKEVSCD